MKMIILFVYSMITHCYTNRKTEQLIEQFNRDIKKNYNDIFKLDGDGNKDTVLSKSFKSSSYRKSEHESNKMFEGGESEKSNYN